jgi:hypothetical protein
MAMPPDYAQECLYGPEAWFIHDLLELDPEAHRVVGLCDTTQLEPFVSAQRVWPGHPRHFPGAVAVQITGTLGHLHAVYCLGLKSTEGWVGFGTHIKSAKFHKLGEIGPPVHCELHATRVRTLRGTWFVTYRFTYRQRDQVIYTSEQTAAWVRDGGAE